MTNDDERDPPSPQQPTLFEKRPDAALKRRGSRVHVGVYMAAFIAVFVILAVVLFSAASCGTSGGNGQTTGGIVLVVPTLPG